ncbi:MAG: hypothetical protein ACOCPN_03455, partial [Desulfonatronovibrionaceae bacterium]
PDAAGPPGAMRTTPHFHNTIIEALVAWGVAGTALLLAIFIIMLMYIHQAWKNKKMGLEMYLFLMGGALLVAVSGMTHSLGVRQTTWTYAALWAGPAFSYCFRNLSAGDFKRNM